MAKYENVTWRLLNVDELPKFKSGNNKGKIDYENCVGKTLKYELKANRIIYEIKIVEYIKGCKDENGKKINSQFKVEYIFLRGTEYEEVIEKNIRCSDLINRVNVGGVIQSLNQWIKEDEYWIGIDTKGREFKFSTNNKETEYNILHSTWSVNSNKDDYIMTGNLGNSSRHWYMHRVIYFNCDKKEADKNIHMCIDHKNNDRTDNRMKNLRLVTKAENSKNRNTDNKLELVGLRPNKKGNGYYSHFSYEKYNIDTKVKYALEEAKIDNLIAQNYLGRKHNEDQFYKLEGLSKERIKEVTDLIDKKIQNNKNKVKKEKEYAYDFIEKDDLIGIKTFKKDYTPNEICWVDGDFGRIEGDRIIVEERICINEGGYFIINNNKRINVYIMVGEMSIHNYRNNNFHVDHINQKTNENYRDNLEIVTIKSNMMNKEGKGYCEYKREKGGRYRVFYARDWKYFDLYIKGIKNLTFYTEEEAIAEVKRRKEIVNKYRFRIGWQGSIENNIKALDEVIDFSEEHDLDIDSAYIVWAGLDTLENIKNYLDGIDK